MENSKSARIKQSALMAFIAVCVLMVVLALIIAFQESSATDGAGQHFLASRDVTQMTAPTQVPATPTAHSTQLPTATPDMARPTVIMDPDLE